MFGADTDDLYMFPTYLALLVLGFGSGTFIENDTSDGQLFTAHDLKFRRMLAAQELLASEHILRGKLLTFVRGLLSLAYDQNRRKTVDELHSINEELLDKLIAVLEDHEFVEEYTERAKIRAYHWMREHPDEAKEWTGPMP